MKNLKKLREEKGITQEQLAEMIDSSRRSVIRWEKGERFANSDSIVRIAKILNVSTDDLLGYKIE